MPDSKFIDVDGHWDLPALVIVFHMVFLRQMILRIRMSDVTDYAGSAIVDMGPCKRATVICQIRRSPQPHITESDSHCGYFKAQFGHVSTVLMIEACFARSTMSALTRLVAFPWLA